MGRFVRCPGLMLAALVTLRLLAAGPAQAAPPLTKTSLTPAQRGELDEAERLTKEAEQFMEVGKYAEALPSAERALRLRERVLGVEHPHVATALNNLAVLYFEQRAFVRAEPLFLRALAIREKTLGPEHPHVAASLNNLGGLYLEQRAFVRAEPLLVRALTMSERALGPDHLNVAQSLNSLAGFYLEQGAYAKAEPLFLRALAMFEKTLGPEHLQVATGLDNLAGLYFEQNAYNKAEPLLLRVLAIREKALGPTHPHMAQSLHTLARIYSKQRAFARAEPLLVRSLAIFEKALGVEHPHVATALNDLAVLYFAQRMFVHAEPLFLRALAIRERTLGPEHPHVAASLNNLTGLYLEQRAFARAEPLALRALTIREKALGPEHFDVAQSLHTLAELYWAQDAYARAELFSRRALTIEEKVLGPDHPSVAQSLNDMAKLYQEQGTFARAEPLFRRALAIREKALGPEHPLVAYDLNNLASLYQEQGAFADAEPLWRRALAIHEKVFSPEDPRVALSLNNLATLYASQGSYARAEPLYQRALTINEKVLGPDHPTVAAGLVNVGSLYVERGVFASAEPLYQRALTINEMVFGQEHIDGAFILGALAGLYLDQGAVAQAETLSARALAIEERVLGPEHPRVAASLTALARLYLEQGVYARAESLLERALAIENKIFGPEHPYNASTLQQRALLATARGDRARALDAFARAAQSHEHSLHVELGLMSEARKRARLSQLRDQTHATLSFHAQQAPQSDEATRLALGLVLQRKGRVLDELADATALLRQGLTPELQAKLDELSDKRTQLGVRSNAPYDAKRAQTAAEELASLRKDIDRLEGELSAASATFRAQTQPVTVEAVQTTLPKGATLVEFIRYRRYDFQSPFRPWREERYAAYLLRRQGPPRFVDLGEAAALDARVRAARAALTAPTASGDVRGPLRALDALLLAPLRKALGPTPHLLLSPDSELNLVPFEALIDEQGRYLLETTLVTYLSSGRDVLRLRERPAPRSGPLVIAGPDYGPGAPFVPLPGAAAEALEVRQRFPHAAVLQGAAATKPALTQAHGPLFLHVATHGFFRGPTARPTVPIAHLRGTTLESGTPAPEPSDDPAEALDAAGLAFAGANHRPDALVSARELAGLDLQGTELAVLSACESGVGQVASGEGVYGLRRALVVAGAASQVVSLWSVHDTATRRLMGAYYGELATGRGRSEALRRARLAMLAEPATAHPYYWAAFVPAGDWRPLEDGATVPRVAPGGACGCRTAGGGDTGGEPGLALAALAVGATYARRKRPRDPQQPSAPRRSSSDARRADEPLASAPLPRRAALSHRGVP